MWYPQQCVDTIHEIEQMLALPPVPSTRTSTPSTRRSVASVASVNPTRCAVKPSTSPTPSFSLQGRVSVVVPPKAKGILIPVYPGGLPRTPIFSTDEAARDFYYNLQAPWDKSHAWKIYREERVTTQWAPVVAPEKGLKESVALKDSLRKKIQKYVTPVETEDFRGTLIHRIL